MWIAIEPRNAAMIPCAGERRSARRDGSAWLRPGPAGLRAPHNSGNSPDPTGSQSIPPAVYSKVLALLGFRRILRLFPTRLRGLANGLAARGSAPPDDVLQRTATGLSVNLQAKEENTPVTSRERAVHPRAGTLPAGAIARAARRRCAALQRRLRRMSLTRTLVLNVVGLTPALLPHAPNLNRLAGGGGMRPLTTVTPGGHDDRSVHVRDRDAAARSRHRRQRLVFPRPLRGFVLAPVEPPGAGREVVGRRQAARSRLHLRQAVLVVQHVFHRRHRGDAAADVSRRRPQAAGHPHLAGRAARRAAAAARPVPAVPLLGPGRGHRLQPLDRALRAGCIRAAAAHA